jgi:hypothetical protein
MNLNKSPHFTHEKHNFRAQTSKLKRYVESKIEGKRRQKRISGALEKQQKLPS